MAAETTAKGDADSEEDDGSGKGILQAEWMQ